MSDNGRYVVTGGGTMGEGIQVWDMRNLKKSVYQIRWDGSPAASDYYVNPTINTVKFANV
jgi:hypothetical protein